MSLKPRKLAHIGFVIVVAGLLVSVLVPAAVWIAFGLWALSIITGALALARNGRIFPATTQMVSGRDKYHLDIFGFVEVYLAILPALATIAILIFISVNK